jgi:hypothetical protein
MWSHLRRGSHVSLRSRKSRNLTNGGSGRALLLWNRGGGEHKLYVKWIQWDFDIETENAFCKAQCDRQRSVAGICSFHAPGTVTYSNIINIQWRWDRWDKLTMMITAKKINHDGSTGKEFSGCGSISICCSMLSPIQRRQWQGAGAWKKNFVDVLLQRD